MEAADADLFASAASPYFFIPSPSTSCGEKSIDVCCIDALLTSDNSYDSYYMKAAMT